MRAVDQTQTEGTETGLPGAFVFFVSVCSKLSTTAFEQAWGLDKAGNWSMFDQDDQGNGAWDLEQTRATNNGNEIVGIGASVGSVWAAPTYDPPGNMISFPKPDAPTASFGAVYDAWNRLVTVLDGEDVVAEYAYDGRSYRVRKTVDGQALHYYYNSSWQLLEERVATPTPADLRRQYVWGIGINSLVLRDRDTDDDGILDERLCALQDSHWDMCAVVGETGSVVERYEYEAYGKPRVLDPAFEGRSASVCAWEVLFQGAAVDGETGLYQVRYRYYHPTLGSWISRDPLFDHWMGKNNTSRRRQSYNHRTTSAEMPSHEFMSAPTARGTRLMESHSAAAIAYQFGESSPLDHSDVSGLCASLDDQWKKAGIDCCASCEYEALKTAKAREEEIRTLYLKHQDEKLRELRKTRGLAGAGKCERVPGQTNGKWSEHISIDEVETCKGYCTWVHEDFHRRECENNPWNDSWEMVTIEDEALHELPAYAASIQCLSNMIRQAENEARQYGGDMKTACDCCRKQLSASRSSIPGWVRGYCQALKCMHF